MSHITKIKGAKLRSKAFLLAALSELGWYKAAMQSDENELPAVTPWQRTHVNILAAFDAGKDEREFGFVVKRDDKGIYYELQADTYATRTTAKKLMVQVTQRYVALAAKAMYEQQGYSQLSAGQNGADWLVNLQRADAAALSRVEIEVNADGEVTEHMTGVNGAKCQQISSPFQALLDGEVDFQPTAEYFQSDQFGCDFNLQVNHD